MGRTIRLQWASSQYVLGRDDGVRIRIWVESATEITDKIFAYRGIPQNPAGVKVAHFSHVCSPVDIEEYPEDEPNAVDSPQWSRLNYVDVLVRSTEEAEDFQQIVVSDVRRLIATLNRADTLFQGGNILVDGTADDAEEPTASSSSASSSAAGPSSSSSA